MAIIGIDLGTTNSLCAVWRDNKSMLIPNSFGDISTPSVVSMLEDGTLIAGKLAKERMATDPEMTVSSFKIFMGSKKTFRLGNKDFLPEDLSAVILRQIKRDAELYLKEPVTEAVISVPAYFNDSQRTATKLAGELSGLTVNRIINEPSAAALAYRNGAPGEGTFIVLDLGGGTLDISLVDTYEDIVEILAIAGDNHLGGDDFDNAITEKFYELNPGLRQMLSPVELAAVKRQAEVCKIALGGLQEVAMVYSHRGTDYSMVLSREMFVTITAQYFSKIRMLLEKVMRDSHTTASQIDEVLLVGGSTRMGVIKDYVASLMKQRPNDTINPDEAIALGTGVTVGIMERQEGIRDVVLTDICPFTLGTSVYEEANGRSQFFPMIERNSTLPSHVTHYFTTVNDNQTQITFRVYQGESLNPEENLLLETIVVPIPKKPAEEVSVKVIFAYDINGILIVDATCIDNGKTISSVVTSGQKLTEEEKQRRVEALRNMSQNPADLEENRVLIERALELFENSTEHQREIIAHNLTIFERILNSNRLIEIEKSREQFQTFLESIDEFDVWR